MDTIINNVRMGEHLLGIKAIAVVHV